MTLKRAMYTCTKMSGCVGFSFSSGSRSPVRLGGGCLKKCRKLGEKGYGRGAYDYYSNKFVRFFSSWFFSLSRSGLSCHRVFVPMDYMKDCHRTKSIADAIVDCGVYRYCGKTVAVPTASPTIGPTVSPTHTPTVKPLTIYVRTPSGTKVEIRNVKLTDTVSSVKRKVQKKTRIPRRRQVLQDKTRRELSKNSKSIGEYGVKDRDTLIMPITIYVQTPKGKRITIRNVSPEDPVRTIKKIVQKKLGFAPRKQVLKDKLAKRLSRESKQLCSYGVKDKDTLRLAVKIVIYVRKLPNGKKSRC